MVIFNSYFDITRGYTTLYTGDSPTNGMRDSPNTAQLELNPQRCSPGVFERTPAAAVPDESATHEASPALAAATSLVGFPGNS